MSADDRPEGATGVVGAFEILPTKADNKWFARWYPHTYGPMEDSPLFDTDEEAILWAAEQKRAP